MLLTFDRVVKGEAANRKWTILKLPLLVMVYMHPHTRQRWAVWLFCRLPISLAIVFVFTHVYVEFAHNVTSYGSQGGHSFLKEIHAGYTQVDAHDFTASKGLRVSVAARESQI